ncbi:Na+/H+ antiporter subunit E [Candidatus Bipolaricaulota bacterium]|jgi:multicomponent Na+:H+ antiporter subunit E|nr:Na+/H+ antiporter subunit E [Candidatus Bipolaricaulota bacterium]
MLAFFVTAIGAFFFYLLLTFGSGTIVAWSLEEWISGAVLSLIVGAIAGRVAFNRKKEGRKSSLRMLNPLRWLLFLVYLIGPFLWAMAKANLDVAYRVITGKIRPGIVRLSPGLSTDFGTTLLANSITLTPGTLTVDVDEESGDLFVHWINVRDTDPSAEAVCGSFVDWARRIAE